MAAIATIGTVLSAAQTLFGALENQHVQEICSILGYKSELESLKDTVSTVKAVLLDAESKQELSYEALDWISKLKAAVYDADDLLDEFTTLAEQQQQQLAKGGKITKKVRLFFSRFTQMGVAYTLSRGIKIIRKKLERISSNHTQFGFTVDYQPIRQRREETCSYVFGDNVIGRENETRDIIDILLKSDVQSNISFLVIVGMGGLGKTTLAQLVYNHKSIIDEFPLRLWVCVGDYDQKHFDMRAILAKILESATKHKHEDLALDVLQNKLRRQLEGKKYLLVLDDLWNEDRNECLKFRDFLMGGGRGSRILVTSRSDKVATVVGDGHKYNLHGLSDDNSWLLFKKMAFMEGQEQSSPDLVDIGKDIVKKCANVPLAIRVVGTLLYGQDKNNWLSFQNIEVANIRQGQNDIMSILKFSYYHLESELKSCFRFCALFPKDFKVEKEMLVSLWMAQGCIVPLDQGQSIEDASEEYFSILVRRCFFQDVEKDRYGEIISCKIHDLMHDIAQEVAGKEISIDNCSRSLDKDIRHLSVASDSVGNEIFNKSKIRTYLHIGVSREFAIDPLLANWTCLRTLDLHGSRVKNLPSTISKLLHLRYLDLSRNPLKILPKSITRLHNLQSLKLRSCDNLEELPKDLSQLIKLRLLDIQNCSGLIHMPPGMDKLTCLAKLPMFVVGEVNSSLKQGVGQLGDLKPLNNLKGVLQICIHENYTYLKEGDRDGGYLRSKEHLKKVDIVWKGDRDGRRVNEEESLALALLEDLQPHCNLKGLELIGYCGARMPSWGREDNLAINLPNLVDIKLWGCSGLKYIPSLSKLRDLKRLVLRDLQNLEYVEISNSSDTTTSSSRVAELSFFPSLEQLELDGLPKLEGWWRDDQVIAGDSNNRHAVLPSFPRLINLIIRWCPRLTSIPPCQGLESLDLVCFNEKLEIIIGGDQRCVSTSPKLRKIKTSNLGYLNSLPTEAFRCLSRMIILWDMEVESLSEVAEVFRSCSSSLHWLEIVGCHKLKGLSGGWSEHLTSLESLHIITCENLNLTEEDDNDDDGGIGIMPWKSLGHTLRSLTLEDLPKLVNLPMGMRYLTSLRSLCIHNCDNLEALPSWMPCFTSLQRLYFNDCLGIKSLMERCQKPTGEDWPKIQHIPRVFIDGVEYQN